jgi:hypothetical protein
MTESQLEKLSTVKEIRNWKELNDFYEEKFCKSEKQWLFRGQKNSSWGLKSTLEREIVDFGIDMKQAPEIERGLLRKFRRQCHNYTTNVPEEDDSLEWLALMRHYGAPVRLLDWTYSFFVATYFAIEFTEEAQCAVWAINMDWMKKPLQAVLKAVLSQREDAGDAWEAWDKDDDLLEQSTFRTLFMRKQPLSLVAAVNPQRLIDRQLIQQGVFLCPGDVSDTFESNLITLLSELKSEAKDNFVKIKIDTSLEIRKDILLRLQRMNMNNATLFPGLAGFAQSLRTLMIKPEIFLHPGHEGQYHDFCVKCPWAGRF